MATVHDDGALAVPHGADDLGPAWLSEALAPWSGGARLTGVRAAAIGNGMVADSLRLELDWDRPTAAPSTIVAKVASSRPESRAAAEVTRTYLLEAAFYNELASTVEVRVPHCFLARYEATTGDYVVLLEDVAPAAAGDQILGCSVDEAAGALPELVALHAPRWGDPTLEAFDWLDRPSASGAAGTAALFEAVWPGFVDRFGSRVDADVLALGERLRPDLAAHLASAPRPWTLLHGDFRLDNLLFGGPRVVVVDWQTVRVGPAMADAAYFLGASLLPADRRAGERDLVGEYHGRLRAAGIDIGWDECWTGYRRHGLGGLLMGVIASMLVSPTERGDEMFLSMVNRHGIQLLDLDAEALLRAG